MTQSPLQIGAVRYNAKSGAFEAPVDLRRDGRTYRFPCQVAGPVTMDADRVTAGLIKNAILMSDHGTKLQSWH